MVEYNIVKFCRFCKARFVVPKGRSFEYLCKACNTKENSPVKTVKKAAKSAKKKTSKK